MKKIPNTSMWLTVAAIVALAVLSSTASASGLDGGTSSLNQNLKGVDDVGKTIMGWKEWVCGILALGAAAFGATGFMGGHGPDWKKIGSGIGAVLFILVVYTILP